jgi:hypothetical protein
MNAKIFSFTCALSLLVMGAFMRPAAGDPNEPQRESAEAAPASANAAVAKTEAELVAHLQELEAARRKVREKAIKEVDAWAANRAVRAAQHRQQIAQLWGNVVGSIDAQAALRMNADRMARLNRMLDLAEQKADASLISRVRADITHELSRHARAMQKVRALSGLQ